MLSLSPLAIRLATAALPLIAKQGWHAVTVASVAKAAKIKLAEAQEICPTPAALIPLIAALIDHHAYANITLSSNSSMHDRLFDLLMARFDVMQPHREAFAVMAAAARHDRALALALLRAAPDSAYRVMAAAEIKTTKPPRPVIAAGLIAVYAWAFRVWLQDTSRDMAKTMAATDRALNWADRGIKTLTRWTSPAPRSEH